MDFDNYLCTSETYWTLSPVMIHANGAAFVGSVWAPGSISEERVETTAIGVRPVVSLANSTFVTGSGTTTNPYVVK